MQAAVPLLSRVLWRLGSPRLQQHAHVRHVQYKAGRAARVPPPPRASATEAAPPPAPTPSSSTTPTFKDLGVDSRLLVSATAAGARPPCLACRPPPPPTDPSHPLLHLAPLLPAERAGPGGHPRAHRGAAGRHPPRPRRRQHRGALLHRVWQDAGLPAAGPHAGHHQGGARVGCGHPQDRGTGRHRAGVLGPAESGAVVGGGDREVELWWTL